MVITVVDSGVDGLYFARSYHTFQGLRRPLISSFPRRGTIVSHDESGRKKKKKATRKWPGERDGWAGSGGLLTSSPGITYEAEGAEGEQGEGGGLRDHRLEVQVIAFASDGSGIEIAESLYPGYHSLLRLCR